MSHVPVWPDAELERQMISDAESPSCNPNGTDRDVACHVKALLCRVRELEGRCEQYEVQLAGVLTAAEGGLSEPVVAKEGDYGWSFAYQRVLETRCHFDRCRNELERLLDVVHECDQVLIQMSLDNESFEPQQPFHVLPIEDANHLPFNPLLNPPPGISSMMERYIASAVDSELIKQAKDGPARAIFTTPEPLQ